MLTMAVGQSDDVDPATAVAEAIEQCRAELAGHQPKVAILISAQDSYDPNLPIAVRNAFPDIEVIGTTSAAEMSSVGGYREDSVALAVFASDEIEMAVGFAPDIERDATSAAGNAVLQAKSRLTQEPRVCVVFAEGLNAQRAVEALRKSLPVDVLMVGGGAGRNEIGGNSPTYQFWNDKASTSGMVILLMAGPIAYSSAVGTGWRVLGPRGLVTRSSYGAIHEIDGKPATGWASTYLDMRTATPFGNPLAVQDAGMNAWYLRVVVGAGDDGDLRVTGLVPEGATVQLTTTNPDDMLQATTEALKQARTRFPAGSTPQAALLFSCAVRKYVLGSRTAQEFAAAKLALPDALPMAGLYCLGEIAPAGDAPGSHFLNETFVAVLLGT